MSISDWNSIFSPTEDDQYSFDYGSSSTTSPLKSVLPTSSHNMTVPTTVAYPNVTVSATGATSGATLMTSNGTLNWGEYHL